MALKNAILLFAVYNSVVSELCPKQCDCDFYNGLNRAMCVDQNIVNINVGVPNAVQIYSLSHNFITELDNFCFKEAGYTSVEILNLSNNHIFWIGLHAFSGLNKLLHLDLSNNALRFVTSDLFWDTPQLDNLDLSSNAFESLKNEPIIMHAKLQILNLNNCRIKSLPDRIFSRLPNLKKLDLSENYMITVNTEVLRPLKKLERIELRNEYWKCSPEFIAVETWLTTRNIAYEKQCRKKLPKMSEKMLSQVPVESEPVELDNVWNITVPINITKVRVATNRKQPLTPFEKFDKEFSATQALIIGFEIGLAVGIVATYIWLRRLCHCCSIFSPQRRVRRGRRQGRLDGDMRANLLWSTVVSADLDTPPLYRRELSLPERSPPYYGVPGVTEARLQVDAVRLPDRGETPPPPYNDYRNDHYVDRT